ncbi:MAG: AmmeMemoRadiSam system protein A [Thiobacillaceae bacterium]|jgi:AmmeMemoRadiSam system protein A
MSIEYRRQFEGAVLLDVARAEIAESLGLEFELTPAQAEPWLTAQGATFVTLTKYGELRGCIGTLEAYRPLIEDVRQNARAAAFRDPRFSPVREEEFTMVSLEVSLLSIPEPMAVETEAEAMARLRPHIDGVVLEYGRHRSTFLPQVWEQLPDPYQFLMHLKRKAGLAADFWADGLRLSRYGVQKWKEADVPR